MLFNVDSVEEVISKKDYFALSEIIRDDNIPTLKYLLNKAEEKELDINSESGREIWHIAIDSINNDRNLQRDLLEKLVEVYKPDYRKALENSLGFLFGLLGGFFHSGRPTRAVEYKKFADRYFNKKFEREILNKIYRT